MHVNLYFLVFLVIYVVRGHASSAESGSTFVNPITVDPNDKATQFLRNGTKVVKEERAFADIANKVVESKVMSQLVEKMLIWILRMRNKTVEDAYSFLRLDRPSQLFRDARYSAWVMYMAKKTDVDTVYTTLMPHKQNDNQQRLKLMKLWIRAAKMVKADPTLEMLVVLAHFDISTRCTIFEILKKTEGAGELVRFIEPTISQAKLSDLDEALASSNVEADKAKVVGNLRKKVPFLLYKLEKAMNDPLTKENANKLQQELFAQWHNLQYSTEEAKRIYRKPEPPDLYEMEKPALDKYTAFLSRQKKKANNKSSL